MFFHNEKKLPILTILSNFLGNLPVTDCENLFRKYNKIYKSLLSNVRVRELYKRCIATGLTDCDYCPRNIVRTYEYRPSHITCNCTTLIEHTKDIVLHKDSDGKEYF